MHVDLSYFKLLVIEGERPLPADHWSRTLLIQKTSQTCCCELAISLSYLAAKLYTISYQAWFSLCPAQVQQWSEAGRTLESIFYRQSCSAGQKAPTCSLESGMSTMPTASKDDLLDWWAGVAKGNFLMLPWATPACQATRHLWGGQTRGRKSRVRE